MAANPAIDIDLKERQSADIARSVAAGFAEIGILSGAVATTGLTLRPFALDRLVMVARRDHPLALKARLCLADLVDEPFIGLSDGALQQHIDMQAARLGARLKTRLGLRDFAGICRMAAAGVGIAIVPEAAARRARCAGLAMTRLDDDWATRRLSVCVHDEAALAPPARSLFAHLARVRSLKT